MLQKRQASKILGGEISKQTVQRTRNTIRLDWIYCAEGNKPGVARVEGAKGTKGTAGYKMRFEKSKARSRRAS